MSGLTPEQIDLFAMAVCNWWESGELAAFPESPTHLTTEDSIPCSACRAEAEGLAPVVAALIAEAVEQARAEVAAELEQRADEVYAEDIFPKPSPDYYAEVNALLKRERGHQLDRIAADCYRRALRGAASAIRDHEVSP